MNSKWTAVCPSALLTVTNLSSKQLTQETGQGVYGNSMPSDFFYESIIVLQIVYLDLQKIGFYRYAQEYTYRKSRDTPNTILKVIFLPMLYEMLIWKTYYCQKDLRYTEKITENENQFQAYLLSAEKFYSS